MITFNTVLIEEKIAKTELSKTAFAKECDIDIKTLRKILSGDTNMRVMPCCKLAVFLRISFEDLIIRSNF